MNPLSTLHAAPPRIAIRPPGRATPGTALHAGIVGNADEARQCFALRYAANVADGKRSVFLDHRRGVVRDALDDIATVHWVKDGERVVGTLRSVWGGDALPDHYRDWYGLDRFTGLAPAEISFTSRLILAPEYRRSRALPLLLRANYRHGRARGARVDFMHASPELAGLYERLGYQGYRAGVVDTDVGCHLPMLLTADDHDWLAAIRSPFSAFTTGFEARPGRRDWLRDHGIDDRHLDGMTPNLLGADGFAARLARHGGADLIDALRAAPDCFRASALFVARAGDTVARSRDRFGAALVQLSGSSALRVEGAVVAQHAGRTTIEAFTRPAFDQDRDLVALTESVFLCHPPLPQALAA
jgi:hypothetical protein